MEKRILLEKRGRPDNEITELILDNCRSTYVDGLTDSFTALETLSLINVGLVSLKNFPKLSNLRKLELSDNRISNGLNHLTGSPKLTHLNLSGNRIKDFEELQPLKDLENLEALDLFNNQVTLIENYREKLFQLIPSLNYLDGFDKEYVEAPSDEEDMGDDGNEQPSQFSINGIEIDLDELELFEARIRQKRFRDQSEGNRADETGCGSNSVQEGHSPVDGTNSGTLTTSDDCAKDDLDLLYEEIQHKRAQELVNEEDRNRKQMASFLSVLLMFTSLLAFVNQICFRGEQLALQEPIEQVDGENGEDEMDEGSPDDDDDGDGGSEEEEAEDSCEESDEVSLAYLYNDNLEEDQEDWKSVESDYNNVDDEFDSEDEEEEEGGENAGEDGGDSDGEGEDDDGEEEEEEDGDEEDGEEAAEAEAASVAAAETEVEPTPAAAPSTEVASTGDDEATKATEPEARGKKRKFQGTDSDG
uniref:U2A'/phosphoprotein 32 family A C-terminal domain-containing protein n=1 Tax=Anopheles farauti TaxID=69004 RepID=A0A182QLN5_9DIPT